MAGKIVDVTLRLIDKISSPLNAVGASLKDSSGQWIKAGKDIEKVGNGISAFGGKLTSAITVPVATMGAAAVQNFGNVDKTLKLVESTMGDAKWATGDLEGALKKAAANSVFSMDEAAEATLNFARQGFDAKKSAEMLEPALSLAAGTETDLAEVTSGLGNTLKVFESQGLTASDAANIFAQAQAQANTTTSELFEAMSVGSSIFKTVGWSMQDLAAVTDVFGDNFISGSEGATAMKTGLARLVSPAKDGAAWIERLRLNVTNTDGTMKSMVEVQGQLHDAFAGLTQEQQMQAASAIFGKNQMGKWLTLINTAPETVQNYRNSLDDLDGTANGMANSLLSGVGGSIEKLKSTFDVFTYSIGSNLAGPAQKGIDKITGMIDAFNNLDEASQKSILKYAGIAAAVGPAILMFGKTVTTIGKVVSAVGKVGKAFKTFGTIAGIITSPVGIVIGVLAALVVAGVLVYKNWDKIKSVAANVFGHVRKIMQTCGVSGDSLKEKLAPIGVKFTEIGEHAKALWVVIEPVMTKIGEIAKLVFKGVLGGAIGSAIGFLRSLLNSATDIFGGLLKMFDGVIVFLTGLFTKNWKQAFEGLKNIFSGAFQALAGLCKAPMNAVISIINGAIAGINSMGITIPDWVPGLGGKDFHVSIPTIPMLYSGTDNWPGGPAMIHDRGAEIVDLPQGTRVYPHDKSIKKAYQDGAASKGRAGVVIEKIADTVVFKKEEDMDKFIDKFAKKLEEIQNNGGGNDDGYIPELG